MLQSIWENIEPAVVNLAVILITSVISVVGVQATKALSNFKESSVNKLGADRYNFARTVAIGLYQLYEDKFKDIANSGALKKAEMEKELLKMFPSLTQTELDAINKDIWAQYNNAISTSGIAEPAKVEVQVLNPAVDPIQLDTRNLSEDDV